MCVTGENVADESKLYDREEDGGEKWFLLLDFVHSSFLSITPGTAFLFFSWFPF
jgi:hypothetical protein